jgi:hypothetical protein
MRFMITFNHIAGEWDRLAPEARELHGKWLERFAAELRERRDGRVEVKDGPYLASTEQVGGYDLIDADSVEEAVEWASRGRWRVGSNEVRPIFTAPEAS